MAVNTTDSRDIPKLTDLCLFRDAKPGEQPPAEAGAAMLALIAAEQFPTWALAFYDALAGAGEGQDPPPRLALIADDAILLAPQQQPGGWRGFLIAEGGAAGQLRPFSWPGEAQPCCWAAVPRGAESAAAVWGEEAAFLPIRPSPDTPSQPELTPP